MKLAFATFSKLQRGDKVAIVSPSFAAPGKWPHVYELGLKRLREDFGLVPVEYSTTRKIGASTQERAADLASVFMDPEIRAVIATLGGNDQVTYVKDLPIEPFTANPKPFFGFSDNSQFANFLWLRGIPSFYGGCLFTQFAKEEVEPFTSTYLKAALFEGGEKELESSPTYNDVDLTWDEPQNLEKTRVYEINEGWEWDGNNSGRGITWGGCLESIDEMLRHGITIPTLEQFEEVVLLLETSEEIPKSGYVFRVLRALGERGILERIQGVLVGRPKAWNFTTQWEAKRKLAYRQKQREVVLETIRLYNQHIPVVQNLDFGHTNPQICMPYGGKVVIMGDTKQVRVRF